MAKTGLATLKLFRNAAIALWRRFTNSSLGGNGESRSGRSHFSPLLLGSSSVNHRLQTAGGEYHPQSSAGANGIHS
jgi:hypothetical protein